MAVAPRRSPQEHREWGSLLGQVLDSGAVPLPWFLQEGHDAQQRLQSRLQDSGPTGEGARSPASPLCAHPDLSRLARPRPARPAGKCAYR